jgi:integrase
MRQGELGRTAILRETKNGRPRAVPLSTKAYAAIKALAESASEKVFPLTSIALDKRWRTARDAAGGQASEGMEREALTSAG